ncbi:MAG: hypothetical protein V9H26_25535 [Verrucomicrobiota bacterium]
MARTRPQRALLNLFFAGVLGLVLPFICWGAQATPGHPHARAHFVFWPPDLTPAGHEHSGALVTASALGGDNGQRPADGVLPAGQSTPPLLAIFLLLLMTLVVFFLLHDDAPGFVCWWPALLARRVVPRRDLAAAAPGAGFLAGIQFYLFKSSGASYMKFSRIATALLLVAALFVLVACRIAADGAGRRHADGRTRDVGAPAPAGGR